MMFIYTLKDFIIRIESLKEVSDAYLVFENECCAELQYKIYSFAAKDVNEPFRSAMINLGYAEY
jgi:hypothetical protein